MSRGLLLTLLALLAGCGGSKVRETPLVTPVGAPARQAWGVSVGPTHVLALESDDGVRWFAVGPDGEVDWQRRHSCPGPAGRLLAASAVVVCKGEAELVAVSAATGDVVWRWPAPGQLWRTAIAGDRVIAGVGADRVVALAALTGAVLSEWKLAADATFLGVANGVAFEHDRSAAGLRGRRLDGTPQRWSVPYRADAGPPVPGVGAVAFRQLDRSVLVVDPFGRILRSGEEPGALLPRHSVRLSATEVASFDLATGAPRWTAPWPHAAPPLKLSQSAGVTLVVGADGWAAYRASDGRLVGVEPFASGDQPLFLGASTVGGALVVVRGGRTLVRWVPWTTR